MNTINKNELIDKISAKLNKERIVVGGNKHTYKKRYHLKYTETIIKKVVDAFWSAVADTIADGEKILIQNYITIYPKKFNFEYDLEPIYFNPAKTNKDNKMYFTVVYSNELQSIMQIDNKDFIGSKVKLLRYFINVVSTFLKGDHWSFKLNDGTLQDGIVGTSSMEILSDISNINKDTIATYNNILEKEELLYIYRAGAYKVVGNQMSGITNTYGRYEHKKYVFAEGEEHKEKYADDAKSIRHKTKKTTDRRSLGNKYRCLIKGIGKYDEDTIIDIYNYAVEYNRIHREDDYYIDKLKDLDFFKQYPFINNSNID